MPSQSNAGANMRGKGHGYHYTEKGASDGLSTQPGTADLARFCLPSETHRSKRDGTENIAGLWSQKLLALFVVVWLW